MEPVLGAEQPGILDALADAVVVVAPDAKLRWGNRAAQRLFGRTLEESAGMDVLELVHPDDLDSALLSLDSVQSKEAGSPQQVRVRTAAGWQAVEVVGAPMGDQIVIAVHDLSQRHRWDVSGGEVDRFRAILQNAAPPTLLLDETGSVRSSSAALVRVFGIGQEWIEGRNVSSILDPGCRHRAMQSLGRLLEPGAADRRVEIDVTLRAPNAGTTRHATLVATNLLDDPSIDGVVVVLHDVERRVEAEQKLRSANSLLAATLDATAEGLLAVDRRGRITSYNKRFIELWRIPDEVVASGSDERALEHAVRQLKDPEAFLGQVRALYADPEAESRDLIEFLDGRVLERDSRPQRLDGRIIGRVWSFRDVTSTRQLQSELTRQARQDPLTGLANLRVFRERVGSALTTLEPAEHQLAVVFLDLDDFKQINDSLGHIAGDEMLVRVSERLRSCVRSRDLVARIGGDEFAILLEGPRATADPTDMAFRVLQAMSVPMSVAGRQLTTTTSIGIANAASADTAEDLLRNADLAMYAAKRQGRNRVETYRPEMHAEAVRRLEVESGLRGAASRGELEIHYQPILDAVCGSVSSLEALVRWQHPERGLLGPQAFIGDAEQSDLIVEIGRHVLTEACQQAVRWGAQATAHMPPGIAVNLSPRQLHLDTGLIPHVRECLEHSGLDPGLLTLEITESALMWDPADAAKRLEELEALGLRLALDDFGTGHSSLSHLRAFPIHTVKIDKQFTWEVVTPSGAAMVGAITDLSHALGMIVVAEGVETDEQAGMLEQLGCDLAQGYLFAKPMPPAVATEYLSASAPAAEPAVRREAAYDGD